MRTLLRKIARRTLRPVMSRLRGYLQAELLHELRRDQSQMQETLTSLESLLVTLTLQKTDPEA